MVSSNISGNLNGNRKLRKNHLPLYLMTVLLSNAIASNAIASNIALIKSKEQAITVLKSTLVAEEKVARISASLHGTANELKKVAGGTNLVDITKLPARQATLQDALGFEPGVIMQSFFGGNDQPRLNIRGSGMQSNPVNRGVQLLTNGLPINQADGSFVIGFLDTKAAEIVAVYRGANALRYGGTTLGGAVNIISKNGISAGPSMRVEYGSDNRLGLSGQVAGQGNGWDYFINAGKDSYDGYRHNSKSDRSNASGNVGFDIAENISNRTYFQWSDNYFDIPFVVPKGRAISAPEQVLGDGNTPLDKLLNVYNRSPHRDSSLKRLANKTRFSHDNLVQELAVFYQQLDDTFTDPLKHNVTDSTDYGAEYSATLSGEYLTNHDEFLLLVSANKSDMSRDFFANSPINGSKLQQFGALDLDVSNIILAMQWQTQLTNNLQLVSAAQVVKSDRDISDNTGGNHYQKNSYDSVNPKIGINYQFSDDVRFFANISSTSEAPTYWELVSANVSPKNPAMAKLSLNELDAQESVTLEFGTRGSFASTQWDIALYRSDIDDELISIVSDFAVNGKTANYSAGTIHQGIELEWQQAFFDDLLSDGDNLSSKFVYNYSDFYFTGGEYDGNQIAGVPKHLAQFELRYQSANGIYIAPNIKWQMDDTPIDHANSQQQQDCLCISRFTNGLSS